MGNVKVSAVVVTHNSAGDLPGLLAALRHPQIETIVVDNASQDGSADVAIACGADVVPLPINVGWSRGCNVGAGRASADVIGFVNPDARPSGTALLALADQLDRLSAAAVSPRFVEPDGRPQVFYFRFPGVVSGLFCFLTAGQRLDGLLGHRFLRHRTYNFGRDLPGPVDQPGAACLVLRTAEFRALGGFDDDMFLFFSDTDLCRRLRDRGRTIAVDWSTDVVHQGGASVRQLSELALRRHFQRDYLTYVRRHHGVAAAWLTRVMVVALTGLVPAVVRLLRGRPGDSLAQLRLAAEVVR